MSIEVKTFATLRNHYPSISDFTIDDGDTVSSVMDRIGIPHEKVTIIFINNIHADFTSDLKDGDSLGLFPPIGGG